MSRYYQLELEISGIAPESGQKILDAIKPEWDWGDHFDLDVDTGIISAIGVGALYSSDTEDDKMEDLSKVIWTANGGFCPVAGRFLLLDGAPEFEYEVDDYDRIMKGETERDITPIRAVEEIRKAGDKPSKKVLIDGQVAFSSDYCPRCGVYTEFDIHQISVDGLEYCGNCHAEKFTRICSRCSQRIIDADLADKVDGDLYCFDCYEKRVPPVYGEVL